MASAADHGRAGVRRAPAEPVDQQRHDRQRQPAAAQGHAAVDAAGQRHRPPGVGLGVDRAGQEAEPDAESGQRPQDQRGRRRGRDHQQEVAHQ
jgi:hypothetical protein